MDEYGQGQNRAVFDYNEFCKLCTDMYDLGYNQGVADGSIAPLKIVPHWKKSKPESGKRYVLKIGCSIVESSDWREKDNKFYFEDGEIYDDINLDSKSLDGWMYSNELNNLPKDNY